jgi:hypothetical protein
MASPFHAETLLNALRDACVAAWGVERVEYGDPRFIVSQAPYAVIQWAGASPEAELATKVDYRYTFVIVGRFPLPADDEKHAELQKNDRFNELHSEVVSGATFATIGFGPSFTKLDASEIGNVHEDAYEVAATFAVSATGSRI